MAELKKYRVCGVEVPFILVWLLLVLFVTTVGTIVAVTWKWRHDRARLWNPNSTPTLAANVSSVPDAPTSGAVPEENQQAPHPLPDFQYASEVRVEFGATNRELGLHVVEVGDSKHALGMLDEEEAWLFQAGWNYCYFLIDPTFKKTLGSNAVVRVEFRVMRGNPLGLQYDDGKNRYASASATSFKRQKWDVIEFALRGASFRNAQNGGADFRLYDNEKGFFLKSVSVSRNERMPLPVRPPDPVSVGHWINSMTMIGDFADAELRLRASLANARKFATNDTQKLEIHIIDLARLLYREGKYGEAEPLYREVLQKRGIRLPADSDTILETAAGLARLLSDWAWSERTNSSGKTLSSNEKNATSADRAAEAEKILRNCLDARLGGNTPASWRTADTKSRLGWALTVVAAVDPTLNSQDRLVKLNEAESLLLEGHDLLQRNSRVESIYKRDALERLVRLYAVKGETEKAADWKQKHDDFMAPQSSKSSTNQAQAIQ